VNNEAVLNNTFQLYFWINLSAIISPMNELNKARCIGRRNKPEKHIPGTIVNAEYFLKGTFNILAGIYDNVNKKKITNMSIVNKYP
jgi:hypothetical protein